MNLNDIPTPISDRSEVIQTFKDLPESRTGRVPVEITRDLERHLAAAMMWVYACQVDNQNRTDMIASYEALKQAKL